jgi:hypothetical protein
MWPRWLTDPLSGKTSLARAFWFYGLGGSIAFSAIALLFPATPAGLGLYLVLSFALGIFQLVILWRCAPNSRSAFLGRLVRGGIVVGVVTTPIMLYLEHAAAS